MSRPEPREDSQDRPGAIVLCGGRSTRMGRDKVHVTLHDRTLLQHTVETARVAADPIFVVRSARQALPRLPDGVVIVDDEYPGEGPLGGLLTGLRRALAKSPGLQHVWVSGCDTPFVTPAIVERLNLEIGDFDAATLAVGERWNPMIAVYSTRIIAKLESMFAKNARSMQSLLRALNTKILYVDQETPMEFLINVNTPDDLAVAQRTSDATRPASDPSAG